MQRAAAEALSNPSHVFPLAAASDESNQKLHSTKPGTFYTITESGLHKTSAMKERIAEKRRVIRLDTTFWQPLKASEDRAITLLKASFARQSRAWLSLDARLPMREALNALLAHVHSRCM